MTRSIVVVLASRPSISLILRDPRNGYLARRLPTGRLMLSLTGQPQERGRLERDLNTVLVTIVRLRPWLIQCLAANTLFHLWTQPTDIPSCSATALTVQP